MWLKLEKCCLEEFDFIWEMGENFSPIVSIWTHVWVLSDVKINKTQNTTLVYPLLDIESPDSISRQQTFIISECNSFCGSGLQEQFVQVVLVQDFSRGCSQAAGWSFSQLSQGLKNLLPRSSLTWLLALWVSHELETISFFPPELESLVFLPCKPGHRTPQDCECP